MATATVKYQIATYSGTVTVSCDPNEDDEDVISRAKAKLRRDVGSFPLGYESWKVVDRS